MHPLDISEDYVRQAISLAREARDAGDAPFGAVLVIDGSAVLTAGTPRIPIATRPRTRKPTWSPPLFVSCRRIGSAARSLDVIGPVLIDEARGVHFGYWTNATPDR
jgi:hypothetical protein